ncbi:hypothetical protein KIH41_11360 [Litoribacter ruber]|uniref:hypothetical protein n=1 Tax=Litoribacter ruber TaxID=702568 RepID=UPI001BDB0476|nr:hypothetical protein [Litoribacter ruber]MBT0811875.1 hypothetical protein [Litoribacter ruber]
MKTYFLPIALLTLILGSCSLGEPKCDEVFVTTVPLDYLRRSCDLGGVDKDADEVVVVIRNQADLNRHIQCESLRININFEESFLIAGKIRSYDCGYLAEQNTVLDCGRLVHKVLVQSEDCQAITVVPFLVVIPRSLVDYEVSLKVDYL